MQKNEKKTEERLFSSESENEMQEEEQEEEKSPGTAEGCPGPKKMPGLGHSVLAKLVQFKLGDHMRRLFRVFRRLWMLSSRRILIRSPHNRSRFGPAGPA